MAQEDMTTNFNPWSRFAQSNASANRFLALYQKSSLVRHQVCAHLYIWNRKMEAKHMATCHVLKSRVLFDQERYGQHNTCMEKLDCIDQQLNMNEQYKLCLMMFNFTLDLLTLLHLLYYLPDMEILLSAVIGELTTRSINLFASKISRRSLLDVENHLRRVLLRAQVIVDEAMERQITNQAMIVQLDMLRDTMHRGYYMLDTFIYPCHHDEEEAKDPVVSPSLSLSMVNSVKCLCFSNRSALKQLQDMIDNLSSMILDANDLVRFLSSYPRMYCQPYSMHLQLANCMFGRQMEAQLVINFLLHQQPNSAEELDVMPIVGPGQVGKSTLVAHVRKDERVRAHFSGILFFDIHGFTDDELAAFKDECELKRRNLISESNLEGRSLLIVIELIGDLNEDSWSRLYSASKQYAPKGSKIIVTSRFENIVKYATAQSLSMKYLSQEAYWYFFKTLTFGSMDPNMHPRLTHIAMEIARMVRRSHIGANILARLLRDNFNVQFWCKILAFLRGYHQNHFSRFAEHPFDRLNQNRPTLFMRLTTSSQEIVLYHRYQRFSEEEVPTIKLQDVLYGSVKVHGKFEVLSWRSPIPPYYSYVHSCETRELKTRHAKRKRTI